MTSEQCLIVGAGPAGLAAAGALTGAGFAPLVLEREAAVVPKWRSSYDRLHINTSAWFSHPPGLRYARAAGLFPSRDELVALYERYVDDRRLRIAYGVTVRGIERDRDGWRVATSTGAFSAPAVVWATGKQHAPELPAWPGAEQFPGALLHASRYRRAADHAAERALVVGAGNSAMDIALDLADAGARVWLSVRRPPHVVARQVLGLPHDLFGVLSRRAPRRVVDANARMLARLTVGDLSAFGLAPPSDGAVTRLEREGRVPTVDRGAFRAALRRGKIRVVGGIERFDGGRVVLRDGTGLETDIVVAATGYRAGLEGLVGHLGVLGPDGLPVPGGDRTHPAAPGLYFIGFRDPRSGLLREIRLEAKRIAGRVARETPVAPAPAPDQTPSAS